MPSARARQSPELGESVNGSESSNQNQQDQALLAFTIGDDVMSRATVFYLSHLTYHIATAS